MKYSLLLFVSYVRLITYQYESRAFWKVSLAVIKVATVKNMDGTANPTEIEVSIVPFCQRSTNQELFEKHLYNKSSHCEKYGQFLVMQRKPSHATTKLMLFIVSKDEWNIKKDTGKSLKNALHVLRRAKTNLNY